jgi:chromosome partitioning protein
MGHIRSPLGSETEPQRPSGWPNLDIITANMELSAVRDGLLPRERPEDGRVLLKRLEPLRASYDWILLDCPASFDALTLNALLTADGLIVTIGPPEPLAMDGVQHMVATIGRLQEDQNPRLRLLGVLVSNVQMERATHRHTVERMEEARLPLFSTMISSTARIGAAAEHHQPVVGYAPKSFVADSYRVLSQEVDKRARGWLWNWVAGTAGA